ncbi:hypothetical protein BH20ACT20_BH20ACT20_03020 [soil metagenome]
MAQAQRHQGHGQREAGQQVPRREPEAEHRGGEEHGHEHLSPERGGAHRGGTLHRAQVGQRARQQLAPRAVQQPQSGEHQREHRRPAQQPVLAVDQQGHHPVGALEVAQREGGVGGRLPGQAGRVGRGSAIEGLVHRHVQGHAEQGHLHGAHCERPPPGAHQRSRGVDSDHDPRRHELRAQPGEGPEQGEAQKRLAPRHPVLEPEREQGGARQRRRGCQLGVHGAAVGHKGGRQPGGQRRPHRPWVWHHAQRQAVGQRHRQCRDRREEDLHPLGAGQRVGRGDQQREAGAVGLVQAPLGLRPVAVEVVGVELRVRTLGVLVLHVEAAVLDQRLRGQQVVGLVPAVLGVAEGVQAERGGVDAEEQDEERSRSPRSRAGHGALSRGDARGTCASRACSRRRCGTRLPTRSANRAGACGDARNAPSFGRSCS